MCEEKIEKLKNLLNPIINYFMLLQQYPINGYEKKIIESNLKKEIKICYSSIEEIIKLLTEEETNCTTTE